MRSVIFAAAAAALLAGAAQAQGFDPATVFKQFDTNGDGSISKEEWAAAGRPAERFALVDTNKDDKISPEELATAIQNMMKAQGAGG